MTPSFSTYAMQRNILINTTSFELKTKIKLNKDQTIKTSKNNNYDNVATIWLVMGSLLLRRLVTTPTIRSCSLGKRDISC